MRPLTFEHQNELTLAAAMLALRRAGWQVVADLGVDESGGYAVTLMPPLDQTAEERRDALDEAERILIEPGGQGGSGWSDSAPTA